MKKFSKLPLVIPDGSWISTKNRTNNRTEKFLTPFEFKQHLNRIKPIEEFLHPYSRIFKIIPTEIFLVSVTKVSQCHILSLNNIDTNQGSASTIGIFCNSKRNDYHMRCTVNPYRQFFGIVTERNFWKNIQKHRLWR